MPKLSEINLVSHDIKGHRVELLEIIFAGVHSLESEGEVTPDKNYCNNILTQYGISIVQKTGVS